MFFPFRRKFKELYAGLKIRPLYGLQKVFLKPDQAAVVCLVKNGAYFLPTFIEHYTTKRFEHIFLLDNGSTDQTVWLAKQFSNVSIYSCELPAGTYEAALRKALALKAVSGGWCLCADIDELFDYPYSDRFPLECFLSYLNQKKFTSVLTHLLDLFSEHSFSFLMHQVKKEDIKRTYRFFDLSDIDRVAYLHSPFTKKYGSNNRLSNPSMELLFGGVRKRLYGLNCLLTKHSLFSRQTNELDLFTHVHFLDHAVLADISAVLLHYKFTRQALDDAQRNRESFKPLAANYERLVRLISDNPEMKIYKQGCLEYRNTEQLVERKFLDVSSDYLKWVNQYAERFNATSK